MEGRAGGWREEQLKWREEKGGRGKSGFLF